MLAKSHRRNLEFGQMLRKVDVEKKSKQPNEIPIAPAEERNTRRTSTKFHILAEMVEILT